MTTVLHRDRDIGEVGADLLVFGGPYGNLEATQAVLAVAARHGIPPERTICTGDVVAYCGDPVATADLVRASGIHVVAGNCEESFGAAADDCGCGFEAESACAVLSVAWYDYANGLLRPDQRAWMRSLPGLLRLRLAGRRLAVVHGAAQQVNRFVFASTPAERKLADLTLLEVDGIIGGHSGLPFTQLLDGRLWHNAGAVGLPANDGTPRAWYSLLRPLADGAIAVEHLPLDYDHRTAAAKMRRCGLPGAYADSLESGRWPNNDILPPAETAAAGRRIEPVSLAWQPTAVSAVA